VDGLAGMRDSMAQVRDNPENPGWVGTLALAELLVEAAADATD